jgi:hypothetical protein
MVTAIGIRVKDISQDFFPPKLKGEFT